MGALDYFCDSCFNNWREESVPIMNSLVHDLKTYARQDFPVQEISAYLTKYKLSNENLSQYISYKSDSYTRHLVHKDEDFEILVVCWEPGQTAPIHGHEGEKCWMRVEQGALKVCNYKLNTLSPLSLTMKEELKCEAGFLDGPAEIHSVENAYNEPAVSLHIYAKPFEECDIYCLDSGTVKRVQLVYDSMFREPC